MVILMKYLQNVETAYFDIYLKAQLFQYICQLVMVEQLETRKEVAELLRLKYRPLVQDETWFEPIPFDDETHSEYEPSQSHVSTVEPSIVHADDASEARQPSLETQERSHTVTSEQANVEPSCTPDT